MAHSNPPGAIVWQFTNINAAAWYQWKNGAPSTTSVTMRITGQRVWNTNVISNATVDVVFSDTNAVVLTGVWRSVSSATNIAGWAPIEGDSVTVGYTQALRYVSTTTPPVVPLSGRWRYFASLRSLLNKMVWSTNFCTVAGWTNNWEGEASAAVFPVETALGTIQTNANADYSYGHVLGSGRHQWQAVSGMLMNRRYSPPYFNNGRQCIKVSGERLFGAMTAPTNYNKTAICFLGVGKAGDLLVIGEGEVSNHYFSAFGQSWQEYEWNQVWTTNLTTESSVYPYGTNRPAEGTTCVTNIGASVLWDTVGSTDNADVGYGFHSVGKWLLKWNVAGGFRFVE
jgi:hypothetical protein